jgi:hypothetical protein
LAACVVNSLGDAGVGTAADHGDLRYCVNRANALAGPDSITFSVTGTIKLKSNLPDLTTEITITGPGANLLKVDGTNHAHVFRVPASGVVSISGLTASGGYAWLDDGGGIWNAGQLTLVACAVSGNKADGGTWGGASGGGIYNAGTLSVRDSTVSGNTVDSAVYIVAGAGIYNAGQLYLDNSTVSGNEIIGIGEGYGGGLYASGAVRVRFSTITKNYDGWCESDSGPGVYAAGSVTLYDAIVAGNTVSWCQPVLNVYGSYSGDHNIIDVDARLGVLQDNGGPTMTHKLLKGSPAIDAGDNAGAPDFDQRGPGYARIVHGTIDIGSYEVQGNGMAPGGDHPAIPQLAISRFADEPAQLLPDKGARSAPSRALGAPSTNPPVMGDGLRIVRPAREAGARRLAAQPGGAGPARGNTLDPEGLWARTP